MKEKSKMIPFCEPNLEGNELKYVTDCIRSGWVSSKGDYVKRFEQKFINFCGAKFATSVSSGTSALHLALESLEIKKGSEIILPNITFVSPANMVKYAGFNPIFVDCGPKTWTMDPSKIEKKITEKTKAIIPVHLYGQSCNMDPIMEIARKHNLYVIEDTAQAMGAEYKGKKVGTIGTLGCFSFYTNKMITTGEGGMVVTNQKSLIEKIDYLKNHAMQPERRHWFEDLGFNARMANIPAALGLAQLERIDEFIEIKRKNAEYYDQLLKGVKGIRLPVDEPWAKNIYWLYSILIEPEFPISKDGLISKLNEENIQAIPFYYPLNELPLYKTNEEFKISKRFSETGITLPSSTKLTKQDIEKIVGEIKKIK